jgi:hypothetical protein
VARHHVGGLKAHGCFAPRASESISTITSAKLIDGLEAAAHALRLATHALLSGIILGRPNFWFCSKRSSVPVCHYVSPNDKMAPSDEFLSPFALVVVRDLRLMRRIGVNAKAGVV